MSNTLIILVTVLSTLAIGAAALLAVVYGKKLVGKVRNTVEAAKKKMDQSLMKHEIEQDFDHVQDNDFILEGGGNTVTGHYKEGLVAWVCINKGTKYDSFEELLRNESMPKELYEEVLEAQRRLSNVRQVMTQDIYYPKNFTKYETATMLGQDLFAYRKGNIRVSDRVLITIGELSNKHMGITHMYIAETKIEDAVAVQFIDLSLKDNSVERLNRYAEISSQYMSSEEFKHEDKEIALIQERLEFYNDLVIDQEAVEFNSGRIFLKAHNKQPKINQPAQPVVKQEAPAPEVTVKKMVDEAIKTAIPHHS